MADRAFEFGARLRGEARRDEILVFQFAGGPEDAAGDVGEEHFVAEGVVGVAVGGAEDAGFAVLVDPDDGVVFAVFLALAGGQGFGVGPEFFDDVEFIHGGDPVGGHAFEDGVLGLDEFHRVFALVIVAAAGDAEQLAPVINVRGAVGVHGAVDDDGGDAIVVRFGDAADVVGVGGVGEAFVVDDDVEFLGPVGVVIQRDLRFGAGAAFHDDGPLDFSEFVDGVGELGALEGVVVAAAAGDEEGADGLAGFGVGSVEVRAGGEQGECAQGKGSEKTLDHGRSVAVEGREFKVFGFKV